MSGPESDEPHERPRAPAPPRPAPTDPASPPTRAERASPSEDAGERPGRPETRQRERSLARKWRVALIGGLLVGVACGIFVPSLPGLGPAAAPRLSGQIVANEGNGNVLVLDPTGRQPPSLLMLPPRVRSTQAMRRLDPGIRAISIGDAWWDARRNVFMAVSTTNGPSNQPPNIDSAVSEYTDVGAPIRTTLLSSIEALSTVSASPRTNQELITGNTLKADGARVGLMVGGGRQHVLTRDSDGPVSWSSDGKTLAYSCSIRGGSPELCTYDLRRDRQRVYTLPGAGDVMTPAISPDATHAIVIAALDGSEQPSNLVLINLDNGQAEILTRDAEQRVSPVWSPDGDFIAYATPSAVILRVLQTGQEVTLARVAVASLQWVSTPRQQLGQP